MSAPTDDRSPRPRRRSRKGRPRAAGSPAPGPKPPVLRVLGALVAANLSFSTLLGLVEKGTGFDFWGYLLAAVKLTLPLTLGIAVISLLVGIWLQDRFCEGGTLLLLLTGVLCLSGYTGTFLHGGMGAFLATYEPFMAYFRGSNLAVLALKGVAYSVLSVIGFYRVYGALNFFASILIGAVAPWVSLYVFTRRYAEAERKLGTQDAMKAR